MMSFSDNDCPLFLSFPFFTLIGIFCDVSFSTITIHFQIGDYGIKYEIKRKVKKHLPLILT